MPRCAPVALVLALLVGCGWRSAGSPDAVYRDAHRLLRRGELKAALAQVETGLRQEPSWRFRLLKTEILLTSGDAVGASRYLASVTTPPDAETHARWRMDQGQA